MANSFFVRGLAFGDDRFSDGNGAGAANGRLRTSFVWNAFRVCLECPRGRCQAYIA